LMAPQATTTISLVNWCRSPAISVSTPVTSHPDSLVCNCKTLALVISVKLEYDSRVGRMALWSESALAPTKQGYPSNVSQRMQGLFVRSALTLEDSLMLRKRSSADAQERRYRFANAIAFIQL
jgi:hypothetical protein